MIELRTLGSLDLRDAADGRRLTSVLSQTKRVALLVYLALAGGPCARDRLLSLFWPDVDRHRGSRALNQAVYVLRRGLDAEAIRTRKDGALELDDRRVRCDAVLFESALDRGEAERAMQLYRGEFLDGLFFGGSHEFQNWLDARRRRLRERAAGGAWALSDLRERAGDTAGSASWGRRAVALAPDDEAGVRRLLRLLARSGEHAALVAEFERFRRRLSEEFGVEPAPETRAVLEMIEPGGGTDLPTRELRPSDGLSAAGEGSKEGGPEPPAVDVASPGVPYREAPSVSPTSETSELAGEPGDQPDFPDRTRRSWSWGAASLGLGSAAVVLLAFGAGVLSLTGPAVGTSTGSASRLAVFPFQVSGGEDSGYLGTGIMELLATGLDGAGDFRTVSTEAVLAHLGESDTVLHPDRARLLGAEVFDADAVLLGSVVAASEGGLSIRASLHRSEGVSGAVATARTEGPSDRLFELVEGLAAQLLAANTRGPETRLIRVAARTTDSLDALKAYIRGDRQYREGNFVAAAEAFRKATEADTAFALAHYGLSLASLWADQPETNPAEADERALRHSHRLEEPDRLLIQGYLNWRRGAADSAEYHYRRITGGHPQSLEGWHQLGETLFHYNPLRGRSVTEARVPFERVLRLAPDHRSALWHLAQLDATEGRTSEIRRRLDRLLELEPHGGGSLEVRALHAFAFGDGAAVRELAPELRDATEMEITAIAWRLAVHLGDFSSAREVADHLRNPARLAWPRMHGHLITAQLDLAEGKLAAARAELDALHRLDEDGRLSFGPRVLLALHPSLPREAADLRALLRGLESWDATAVEMFAPASFRIHRRSYFLGLLRTALGDEAGAAREAEFLEAEGEAGLAAAVRAELAFRQGRLADALALLEEALEEVWFGLAVSDAIHARSRERFLRAELLRALGREREALAWYRTFQEHAVHELMYLAPANLRMAQIHEESGEPEEAARRYRRFIELWTEADPELKPSLSHAEERLQAIGSPGR